MKARLADGAWFVLFVLVRGVPLALGIASAAFLPVWVWWIVTLASVPVFLYLAWVRWNPHSEFAARLSAGFTILWALWFVTDWPSSWRVVLDGVALGLLTYVTVRGCWWDREARIMSEAVEVPAAATRWQRFTWVMRGRVVEPGWLGRKGAR